MVRLWVRLQVRLYVRLRVRRDRAASAGFPRVRVALQRFALCDISMSGGISS
jgi:hypothetical protein